MTDQWSASKWNEWGDPTWTPVLRFDPAPEPDLALAALGGWCTTRDGSLVRLFDDGSLRCSNSTGPRPVPADAAILLLTAAGKVNAIPASYLLGEAHAD